MNQFALNSPSKDHVLIRMFSVCDFAIEFVPFAIELVAFAIEFAPFAIEFVSFAIEFVASAVKFVPVTIKDGSWSKHENMM